MSEFFVVTAPRLERSALDPVACDPAEPSPRSTASPLGASASASLPHSPSQSASRSSDSRGPLPVNRRGASLVHEVTDRELFAVAVAVVPSLQTLLARRAAGPRRRDTGAKSALHWVVKKKRHGLEIKEFDRSAIALPGATTAVAPRDSSNSSDSRADSRTPRALRTPRWCQFNRAAETVRTPQTAPSLLDLAFSGDRQSAPPRPTAQAQAQSPHLGQNWPLSDDRVAFAASAHVELGCRLSEALELLFSTDALQFDATMSSLFGHANYKRGDLLLSRTLPHGLSVSPGDLNALTKGSGAFSWLERDDSLVEPAQSTWLALQSVTLRPRLHISQPAAALRSRSLSLAVLAQTRPARDEAVYVMRTLPPALRSRVSALTESDEAGGELADDISVGFHLAGSFSDLSGHQTRVTMCAYAQSPETECAAESGSEALHPALLARRRRGECSASAKYVVSLLAAATGELDKLLRRRRLGAQVFILTPLDTSVFQQRECHVCARRFGLLRAELFCQLCGHLVCRDCSRKFEVEPVARRVRRNRICFTCVAHVDASGVAHVDTSDSTSWTRPRGRARRRSGRRAPTDEHSPAFFSARGKAPIQLFTSRGRRAFSMDCNDASDAGGDVNDTDEIVDGAETPLTPGRQLADALSSGNPLRRARALEVLRRVVQHTTQPPSGGADRAERAQQAAAASASNGTSVADHAMLRKYLEARRRLSNISSWKTGAAAAAAATDGSDGFTLTMDVSKAASADRAPVSATKTSKSVEMCRELRLGSQTLFSSATETEDDDEEPEDAQASVSAAAVVSSLAGVCEVVSARLGCAVVYVISTERKAPPRSSAVTGVFEAASAHLVPSDNRVTALRAAVVTGALSSAREPIVSPNALADPVLRPLALDGGIRFLAAFPVHATPGGSPDAWLCAGDVTPRTGVTLDDYAAMQAFAKLIAGLL